MREAEQENEWILLQVDELRYLFAQKDDSAVNSFRSKIRRSHIFDFDTANISPIKPSLYWKLKRRFVSRSTISNTNKLQMQRSITTI